VTLENYIEGRYKHFKELAYNIARKEPFYEDLLHDSLLSMFGSKHIENLIDTGDFEFYLIRVMYLSVNSPTSPFYKQTIAWNRNRRDFKEYAHEIDKTWLGARMTNEQLDILISRLSEFERLIFQEYIFEGFTYRELSKQTGIPTPFLYRTIDNIKQKIRANVIRKKQ
jgi:DNA-directed RNA polymerase specialized sigma24 family protein